MIYEKSTGTGTGYHDHSGDFAPPSEPPPSYDSSSAPYQPSHPMAQEPIPYPNQQPSTQSPAPPGPSYPVPQERSYPVPQGPPYPTQTGPPSSARPPPPPRNFAPFETITLPALRYRLADGFSPDLPPSHEQPHPFASHDVTQGDWLAFLGDIRRITQSTSEERMRETFGAESSSSFASGLGSGGRGGGLARGLIGAIAEGVTKSMSGGAPKAAQEPISLLIADWNRSFWNHRDIDVSLVLKDVFADPYATTQSGSQRQRQGRGGRHDLCSAGSSGSSRRDRRDGGGRRAQKLAERGAFGTELIADVHQMFGAKESSAAYRAAADEERYGGKPGWCLVLRYTGPANYAPGGGAASGWATRP